MPEPAADPAAALVPVDELLAASGLNRNLLLAWERRYGLLPAARDPRGTRFYTLDQVRHLTRLKQAVDGGHRIGTIAALPLAELERLGPREAENAGLHKMIAAAITLDSARIANLLRVQLRAEGPERFVLDTIMPLMALAGDQWEDHRLTIAGEHSLSLGAKQVLLACLTDLLVPAGADTAIVTTLEEERHEFGAVSATILARLGGVDARYLGPSLPVREIATAAARLKVRYVIVSTISLAAPVAGPALLALREKLPGDIVLIAGGRGLEGLAAGPNLRVEASLAAFSLMPRRPN